MTRYQYHGRTEQRKAAIKRKADAWALFEKGEQHFRGAMYLAGYAIECKLKATAMEVFEVDNLKELSDRIGGDVNSVYTHGLESLVGLMPFESRFRNGDAWKDFSLYVNRWSPAWRYDHRNPSRDEVETYLAAVNNVYRWLEANS